MRPRGTPRDDYPDVACERGSHYSAPSLLVCEQNYCVNVPGGMAIRSACTISAGVASPLIIPARTKLRRISSSFRH